MWSPSWSMSSRAPPTMPWSRPIRTPPPSPSDPTLAARERTEKAEPLAVDRAPCPTGRRDRRDPRRLDPAVTPHIARFRGGTPPSRAAASPAHVATPVAHCGRSRKPIEANGYDRRAQGRDPLGPPLLTERHAERPAVDGRPLEV